MNSHASASKRRIIYAWNYLNWGGSQIYMLSLIKLARNHFEVHLVIPHETDPAFIAFLDGLNVQIHFFSPPLSKLQVYSIRDRLLRRVNKTLSENAMVRAIDRIAERDSIVHVDLAPQQAFRSLFKLARRYKVFTTIHNSMGKHSYPRELLWTIYLRSITKFRTFRIFSGNRNTKSYLCRYLNQKYSDQIVVTTTAINPAEIDAAYDAPPDREQQLARLGLPSNKMIVLTVGQFVDRKGRWFLLDAAKKVIASCDDVVFVWVMPTLPDECEWQKIRSYELGRRFIPVESAAIGSDHSSILRFVKLAELFVLPSIIEGLPIAMLEAIGLGVPTISTNINGIPEAVINGETGVLVAPGNSDDLSCAIIALREDKETRARLSEKGRNFVRAMFDERRVAEIALREYLK